MATKVLLNLPGGWTCGEPRDLGFNSELVAKTQERRSGKSFSWMPLQ